MPACPICRADHIGSLLRPKPLRDDYKQLAAGQHPQALFITCSDSRVVPNIITQTAPGELFVLRNAGNIVPPPGMTAGGEAATIEFAVEHLHVEHIIVCGHSDCGAMKMLLGLVQPTAGEAQTSRPTYGSGVLGPGSGTGHSPPSRY